MSLYPSLTVASSVPAGTPMTQEAARAQRVNQAQYVEKRLKKWNPACGSCRNSCRVGAARHVSRHTGALLLAKTTHGTGTT